MKKYFFISALIQVLFADAQNIYSIDASDAATTVVNGQLKMGNPGATGKEILINNRYMTLNGKPIIPVMGEVHFSRVARNEWEDRILKMKACGVTIIACYVLWIHHEEVEGQFEWGDNKDLRAFVLLCAKHGLWVYPRIGPWSHAEVRNGGTPDWLLQKTNMQDRSNDPVYQHYAETWYQRIALQLKGLFYKEGGPVIGVQLENEYRLGKTGEAHILWLKKTALKYGIDVPIYTVTGWQNGSVPPYEVIPLWGAYPDEPWADNLKRNTGCDNFKFTSLRDNDNIGNDVKKSREQYIDYDAYPFFTCEVGVGIENTEHRRLQIGSIDGLGLIMSKIASGSNLVGYYMFTGGSNPHGLLTTLEENKDETGYWNTNPVISYDFQAAIRESGELNDCYFKIKKLNYFLNEFGDRLAPMESVISTKQDTLQYAVRVKDRSAFLFGLNYCRNNTAAKKKNVQFSVKLKNETVLFPAIAVNIEDSSMFIWPINFFLRNVLLKYATAQPLCHINDKWIFIQDININPELCFDAANIEKVESVNGRITQKNGRYIVSDLKPGLHCIITVRDKQKGEQKIILLSKEEALHAWLFYDQNKKHFLISDANMYMNKGHLHVFDTSGSIKIYMLTKQPNVNDTFSLFTYTIPAKHPDIAFEELKPLDNAQWLKISAVDSLNSSNQLMHRFFLKEFNLGNPSKIKKTIIVISPQAVCRMQLNDLWINQKINSNSINVLDLTGYVQKGNNKLLVVFPFEEGSKAFAAKLVVEYFNADRVEFNTDESWITKDTYTYPSYLTKDGGYKRPEKVAAVESLNKKLDDKIAYRFLLPEYDTDNLNNTYLKIDYTGDKARLYFNHTLVADDFYNGSTWSIELNRFNKTLYESLQLHIVPLQEDARVYFDSKTAKRSALKATVQKVRLVPEYTTDFIIDNGLLKQTAEQ